MQVKSESEVAQSCPTLRDCSLLGSFVHGIFQARVLEWVASAFSMDCSLLGSFVHGIFQARVLEWVASAFSIVKCSTYQIPIVGARQAVVALPEDAHKASIYPTVC